MSIVPSDGDVIEKLKKQYGIGKKPPEDSGGDSTVPSVLDDEFAKLGYSPSARLSILGDVGRENNWNRKTIFGGHADPKNQEFNRGIISWQGDRRKKLDGHLKSEGVFGRGDDEELRGMARFMDRELKTDFPDVYQKLRTATKTYDASEALRRYIKYVPDAPFNSPDPEFRVRNNADWANKARRLGLARGVSQPNFDYEAAMSGLLGEEPTKRGDRVPENFDYSAAITKLTGDKQPLGSLSTVTTGLPTAPQAGMQTGATAEQPVSVPDDPPADIEKEYAAWLGSDTDSNEKRAEFNKIVAASNVSSDLGALNTISEAAKEGKSADEALKVQAELQKRFSAWKQTNPQGSVEQFNKALSDETAAENEASKNEWLAKNPDFVAWRKKNPNRDAPITLEGLPGEIEAYSETQRQLAGRRERAVKVQSDLTAQTASKPDFIEKGELVIPGAMGSAPYKFTFNKDDQQGVNNGEYRLRDEDGEAQIYVPSTGKFIDEADTQVLEIIDLPKPEKGSITAPLAKRLIGGQIADAIGDKYNIPKDDITDFFAQYGLSDWETGEDLPEERYFGGMTNPLTGLKDDAETEPFHLTQRTLNRLEAFSKDRQQSKAKYEATKKSYLASDTPEFEADIYARRDAGQMSAKDADKELAEYNKFKQEQEAAYQIFSSVNTGKGRFEPTESADSWLQNRIRNVVDKYGSFQALKAEDDRIAALSTSERVIEAGRSLVAVIPKAFGALSKSAAALAWLVPNIDPNDFTKALNADERIEDSILWQGGKEWDIIGDWGKNEVAHGAWESKTADVIGQVALQAGAAWMTGGMTLPATIGLTQGGSQAIETAMREGATPDQQFKMGVIGSVAAMPDVLIMKGWFKAFTGPARVGLVRQIGQSVFAKLAPKLGVAEASVAAKGAMAGFVERAKQLGQKILFNAEKEAFKPLTLASGIGVAGKGSLKEGVQEWSENDINLVGKKFIYNPEITWSDIAAISDEDVESFKYGAIGGAFGGGLQIASHPDAFKSFKERRAAYAAIDKGLSNHQLIESGDKTFTLGGQSFDITDDVAGVIEQYQDNAAAMEKSLKAFADIRAKAKKAKTFGDRRKLVSESKDLQNEITALSNERSDLASQLIDKADAGTALVNARDIVPEPVVSQEPAESEIQTPEPLAGETQAADVDAVNISPEYVDETAEREHIPDAGNLSQNDTTAAPTTSAERFAARKKKQASLIDEVPTTTTEERFAAAKQRDTEAEKNRDIASDKIPTTTATATDKPDISEEKKADISPLDTPEKLAANYRAYLAAELEESGIAPDERPQLTSAERFAMLKRADEFKIKAEKTAKMSDAEVADLAKRDKEYREAFPSATVSGAMPTSDDIPGGSEAPELEIKQPDLTDVAQNPTSATPPVPAETKEIANASEKAESAQAETEKASEQKSEPVEIDEKIRSLFKAKLKTATETVDNRDTIETDDTRPERTVRTKAGQELRESRQPKGRTYQGKETEVRIPDSKTTYSARYTVREHADVIPSHNPFNFQPNEDYFFTNDRHYDQEQQYQEQVRTRSKGDTFDPSQLINNNPTSETGPPIIDQDGNVLGGNSRAMILHRIYRDADDRTSTAAASNYLKALKKDAHIYGIKQSELAKFKEPVLVREIDDASIDAQAAITELNKTSTTALTSAERAVAEAGRLTDEAVDYIAGRMEAAGADATLSEALSAYGVDIVNKLIEEDVFTSGERNTLLDGKQITADGRTRIERLLTGRIFDDLQQFELAPPYLKRNIQRAIAPLIKTQADEEWNIIPDTREAIDLLTEFKAKGGDVPLSQYAAQPSFLRPLARSRSAINIANVLRESPNAVSRAFKTYAGEYANAKTGGGLFGASSQPEAFKTAFRPEIDSLQMSVKPPLAPIFFSQLERVIEQKMPNKASADQVRGIIKDTKKEERDWLGIDDWLGDRTVTKDEVLAYVRANEVEIREQVRDEGTGGLDNAMDSLTAVLMDAGVSDQEAENLATMARGDDLFEEALDREGVTIEDPAHRETAKEAFDAFRESYSFKKYDEDSGDTQYRDYTLSGGKDYREFVFHLPRRVNKEFEDYTDSLREKYGALTVQQLTVAEKAKYAELDAKRDKDFVSVHFGVNNPIGHARADMRDDGKTWHIAEIQSESLQMLRDLQKRIDEGEKLSASDQLNYDTLKKFPFQKSWHMFLFKSMLRKAVEAGAERITWDTGETQNERYDLAQAVDWVDYRPAAAGKRVTISYKQDSLTAGFQVDNGGKIFAADLADLNGKSLDAAVGKEIAQQIIDGSEGRIEGENLKVGGAGMIVFYSRVLPSDVNKYVKPWGARVEGGTVQTQTAREGAASPVAEGSDGKFVVAYDGDLHSFDTWDEAAKFAVDASKKATAKTVPVHSLTITTDMAASVRTMGQPLFKAPTAELAAELQTYADIEQFEDKHFAEIDPRVSGYTVIPDKVSHELMRTAKAILSGKDRADVGLSLGYPLTPVEVKQLIAFFKRSGDLAAKDGLSRTGFDKIAKALKTASKQDGHVAWGLPEGVEHEKTHVADARGATDFDGVIKSFEKRYNGATEELRTDADFQQFHSALNDLQGTTSHGAAMAEALAWLGNGDYAEFGLTKAQSINILAKLVNGYATENGVESLRHFDQENDLYEIIDDYRRQNNVGEERNGSGIGSDNQGREAGSGIATGEHFADDRPQISVPSYAEKHLATKDITYTQESMATTQAKGVAALRASNISTIIEQVRRFTANLPANMSVLYEEQKRLNTLATALKKSGKDAEHSAVIQELTALSSDIITAQIQSGRAVNIAKTLEPLSGANAVNVALRLKRHFSGNENAELTEAEGKAFQEIGQSQGETSQELIAAIDEVTKLRKRVTELESDTFRFNKFTPRKRNLTSVQKAINEKFAKNYEADIARVKTAIETPLEMAVRPGTVRLGEDIKPRVAEVGAKILNEGLQNEYDETQFKADLLKTFGDEFAPYLPEAIALSYGHLQTVRNEIKFKRLTDAYQQEGLSPERADRQAAEDVAEGNLQRKQRARDTNSIRRVANIYKRNLVLEGNLEDVTDDAQVVHAGMILGTEKGLSTNRLINRLQDDLGITPNEAKQIAREARHALDKIKEQRDTELAKAANKSPEALAEERRLRLEQSGLTRKMNEMLRKVTEQKNLMQRFNNDVRAKLVLNYGTQLFNVVQSLVTSMPMEIATDAIDSIIRAGTHAVGKTGQLDDIAPQIGITTALLPYAYLKANNRQMAEGVLAEFPEEYFRLELGILPDVNLEGTDTEGRNALTAAGHKFYDKMDRLNNWLSNVTLAKYQEAYFRSAMFLATLDQLARNKNTTLKAVLDQQRASEFYTEDQVRHAVDKALKITFASQIDDPVGRSLKHFYDKIDKVLPVLINPTVYARFTYTVARSVINAHTFGALDSTYLGGKGWNSRSFAKGLLGSTLIGLGYALQNAFGGDDDKWYTMYFDGPDEPPLDIRRFFPLSSFVFTAHVIQRMIEGRGLPPPEEFLAGYASLEIDQYNRSAGMEFIKSLYRYGSEAAGGDLTNEAKLQMDRASGKMLGNGLAAHLRFFEPFRKIFAQINEDERKMRKYDKSGIDEFVGEISKRLPIGQLYGAEVKKNPVTGADLEEIFPVGRLIGLNYTHPIFTSPKPTVAEEKAKRFFQTPFKGGEWTPEMSEAWQIRREIKEAMRRGELTEDQIPALVDKFVAEGKLSEKSGARLKKDALLTNLQETVKWNMSFGDQKDVDALRRLFGYMTEQEKTDAREILNKKNDITPELVREFGLEEPKALKIEALVGRGRDVVKKPVEFRKFEDQLDDMEEKEQITTADKSRIFDRIEMGDAVSAVKSGTANEAVEAFEKAMASGETSPQQKAALIEELQDKYERAKSATSKAAYRKLAAKFKVKLED